MSSAPHRTGRNEVCPCGSGRKYKRCCGGGEESTGDASGKFLGVSVALAGVMLAVGVVVAVQSLLFAPEPARRVWSEEHQHWHEEGGEPDGQPRLGRVWSEEHGHYHDAPSLEPTKPIDSALAERRLDQREAAAAELSE